jgi:hypothetical protein
VRSVILVQSFEKKTLNQNNVRLSAVDIFVEKTKMSSNNAPILNAKLIFVIILDLTDFK